MIKEVSSACENVSYTSYNTTILEGVHFECASGTVTGVLGRNGSGKTTLLKIMSGLLEPSIGEVFYNRTPLKEHLLRDQALMRSYLPQSVDVAQGYRVEHLFEMLGCSHPEPFLKKVGVAPDFLKKGFSRLSGGEQQLVSVALSIAQQSPFWVWDEPCHFLDYPYQKKVLSLMKEHASVGGTVLVSLHDVAHAKTYCDFCVWLECGRQHAWGSSRDMCADAVVERIYGIGVL